MRDVADPGTRELIGGQLVGYVRVSTSDQDVTLQVDALRHAGVGRIFEDVASGAKDDRPGLADATAYLREGDTLTVWRLDRLGAVPAPLGAHRRRAGQAWRGLSIADRKH